MNKADLIIKGGTLVTSSEMYKADIAVKDSKIVAQSADLSGMQADRVVDATGKLVLPGAIDVHTHLAMPFGGTVSADDYFAGTRAAVCGGTTTVFDFAMQNTGERMDETFARRNAMASVDAASDYSFHIGVKDISGSIVDSIEDACKLGVTSFKVFMVYDFGLKDGALYNLLKKSKEFSALIQVHAENNEIVTFLTNEFLSQGKTGSWYHYLSRPEFVEGEADVRAINLARAAGAPLYIVHVANKQGIEAVQAAKADGLQIYAETCPQYLEFTSDVYKRPDGRNFVCSPPIKGEESRQALWEAIKNNVVDTIATDHCPFQQSEKDWGINEFSKIPNGCAGIENMYPYMLGKANEGVIPFMKVVELCCENPAWIFGCAYRKGSLSVGKDADIVIYDPKKDFTITQGNMHSDSDHTIWDGVKVKGYPVQTYLRGRLVYDDGKFVGKRGMGEFVKCDRLR